MLFSNYSFNNQEHDDEMFGDGNAISFDARVLDPRLGRWLSIDPLVSKYPAFSPYNYTAGNPILFVDRDGREIWISHMVKINGKLFIQKVQYKNGELYNADGSKYTRSNAYFMAVKNQLNNIRGSHPDNTKMINELESSPNKHEITNSIVRVGQTSPSANVELGEANYDQSLWVVKKGADGKDEFIIDNTITYYPDPYTNKDDVETGDREGVLAHELKHGYDKQTGHYKKLMKMGYTKGGVLYREVSAVNAQNKVLNSKNKPLRSKYGEGTIAPNDYKEAEKGEKDSGKKDEKSKPKDG